MPTRSKRLAIPSLLLLVVAVAGINAWIAFKALNTLLRNQFWVDHTWEVINQVEKVVGSTKDAELSTRGYVNTGNPAYLVTYRDAVRQLPADLAHFRELTADNPRQVATEEEMHAAIDARLARLQATVDLRARNNPGQMQEFLHSNVGLTQSTHLREIADRMEGEERRLLALRTGDAASSALRAKVAIAIASGLDFLLVLLMFRYFVRERELRLAAIEDARHLAASRLEVEQNAAEILALNAHLEERVRQRTAELEATNRELEAFSYSVSHDLRAPLRTIDGFSLALAEDYTDAIDATGRDYIQRVRTGVQRMGQLIDALLQLSRITRADLTREPVDLSALAESVVSTLPPEPRNGAIEFKVEPGLHADADPKLLRVALENLLGNAAKFTSKVPDAVVEFGWDPGQNAWFVRDNGAGFDMHYAHKLFNAFNRLHGDKDFKGSGIGLATVARVVRRHHGTIWASSVVGHGATFWFTLG